MRGKGLLGGLIALVVVACGTTATPVPAPTTTPQPSQVPPGTAAASTSPLPSPTAPTQFQFDAESVVGYYVTQGFACTEPQPSALAAGYFVTKCQLVDAAGRTRVVGVVTDPDDELADGYASVRGATGEDVLDPTVALEFLAGFLGAMLGPERGEAQLPWLAGHLGDEFASTTLDELQMATYVKDADHSVLYVELANEDYLTSPRPSASPSAPPA